MVSKYIGKKTVIFSWVMALLSLNTAIAAGDNDAVRMVVSAGVLEEHDPFEAFYSSRLFVGEYDAPFYISNAQGLYAFKDAAGVIYYAETPLSKAAVLAAVPEGNATEGKGILGHSYLGWVQGNALVNEKISHYLGATTASIYLETRKVNGHLLYALRRTLAKSAWPQNANHLTKIPVIKLADENNQSIVVFGRVVGSLAQKLGLIDQLMKKDHERSVFLDLGASGARKAGGIKQAVLEEVRKRNPLAVFAGTFEMASLIKDPAQKTLLPFVFPFGADAERSSADKQEALQLWSLAGDENIWPLFAPLGQLRTLKLALARIRDQALAQKKLNIVRVFSETAALVAAKSIHVDLVLMVASDPLMQLPSREVIELKNAVSDSFEQVAPIVHLSRMDVSEVTIKRGRGRFVASVEVIRHPLGDQAPEALSKVQADARIKPGLPSLVDVYGDERPYIQSDFDSILGGMMINATDADIAIFEDDGYATPIEGALSHEVALARLKRNGVVSTITMNGKQLKNLITLKAKKALKRNLVFIGLDEKAKAVRGIAISDAERFKIAISEAALLEGLNIAMLGGFREEYAIRADFVTLIYGKVQNLWFIGGPRTITISDTAVSLDEALKSIRAQISFEALIEDQLHKLSLGAIKHYIEYPGGKPRPTISLDIGYVDLGFSKNVANSTYKGYLDKNSTEKLPNSRGGVPLYAHAIIFSKINLIFDMPSLITTLGNSTKYMHTNFDDKPERDKTTFNLDFRLPWERSLFAERDVVVSPILKNLYETKIAPIPGFSDNDEAAWRKLKVLPRVNRLDSLLGVNVNAKNLGLSFDVGGMMATDFTRSNVSDALDFGPGFNFDGRWPLFGPLELSSSVLGYYLFPLPANTALNKAALNIEGTVWLRLARFHDFSVTLMSDMLLATLQQSPQNVAFSSIFGLTLSYGRFFRLLN